MSELPLITSCISGRTAASTVSVRRCLRLEKTDQTCHSEQRKYKDLIDEYCSSITGRVLYSNSLRVSSPHGSVLLLERHTYSHFYKCSMHVCLDIIHYECTHTHTHTHTHTLWPQPGSCVSEPAGLQLHCRSDNGLSPVLSDNIFNSFWLCAPLFQQRRAFYSR